MIPKLQCKVISNDARTSFISPLDYLPGGRLSDQSSETESLDELPTDDSDEDNQSDSMNVSSNATFVDEISADWLYRKMMELIQTSESTLVLTNLPSNVDSSDMILEFYGAGFHPIRDFDFLHIPMSHDEVNRGYGVINFVDTSTRNAFVGSLKNVECVYRFYRRSVLVAEISDVKQAGKA